MGKSPWRKWHAGIGCLAVFIFTLLLTACGGGGGSSSTAPPSATYTVTYGGNGSTGGSVPVDPATYQQGQMVTVLGNTGSLVKTGDSFSGWNTVAGGTGTAYLAGQTFAMGSANVTLYAQWPATAVLGHAYVVNQYDGPGTVSQLTMGSNGTLTALTPATINCEYDPNSLAVDPLGKYLYAVNLKGGAANTGGSISQYTIDSITGALTAMTPAVVAADVSCTDIAVHPSGKWAYAPSAKNPNPVMVQFTIGGNGGLTQTATTPITEPFTEFLAIHPSGKYLYLVTQGIGFGNIDQYTINQTTGALSPMTPASVTPPGTTTFAITIHPSGNFAYVTDYYGGIYEYTIDPNSGALSPLAQTMVDGSVQFAAWITLDPAGKYAYVANPGNPLAAISQYTVGVNGILTAMTPASVAATSAATNVQVDASGSYVYITSGTSGSANLVTQFAIGANGTLAPMSTTTVGSGPNAIVLVK